MTVTKMLSQVPLNILPNKSIQCHVVIPVREYIDTSKNVGFHKYRHPEMGQVTKNLKKREIVGLYFSIKVFLYLKSPEVHIFHEAVEKPALAGTTRWMACFIA